MQAGDVAADIWQLKVPIRLTLAQDEISSPGDVKPVYLLASRFAYLPALAQQCLTFFQHVLLSLPGQAAASSPWFEYQGLALGWTQPLGVLYDLLTPTLPQQHPQPQPQPSSLPWCLTVHYRSQPASLSNAWQNVGSAKDHFLSSLKEAGYCCRGSDGCNAVMGLNGATQDGLWAAANSGDGAAVARVTGPLRLLPTQRQGSSCPTVPVRLYIRQHSPAGAEAGLLRVWEDVFSTSRAVEVLQADGSPTLLAHLAHTVMPQRFPSVDSSSARDQQQQQQQQQQADDPLGALGGTAGPAQQAAGAPHDQQQQQQSPDGWPDAADCRVLVCGVSPDWHTPLAWLHAQLRAADGFVYVVVHLRAAAAKG